MDKPKNYFEGTLQLRNPTNEIIDFVADEIEKNKISIAKTVKQKNGIDLFLSSNKFLKIIGKRLKDKFPGELISSNSLFTRNHLTSKEVYRGCICFRYYDIKKGDVIEFKGEKVTVIGVGKEILAKDEKNRKIHIKFEQLK